jgi:hypothetical protein
MIPLLTEDGLRSLKRPALQKLAKQYNIKANLKNDTIIKQLLLIEHESANTATVGENESKSMPQACDDSKNKLDVSGCDFLNDSANNLPDLSINTSQQLDHEDSTSTNCTREENEGKENSTPQTNEFNNCTAMKTPETNAKINNEADSKTFSVPKKKTKERIADKSSKESRSSMSLRKRTSTENRSDTGGKRVKRSSSRLSDKNKSTGSSLPAETSIPRFVVSGITTNSQHKAFSKMESIDDYEKRKKARQQRLFGSNRKQSAAMSRLTQPKTPKMPSTMKSNLPRPNFMSPNVTKRKTGSAVKPKSATRKLSKPVPFKPSILSTSNINTNFDLIRLC